MIRREQCPSEEVDRIIEAEFTLCVLDIVVCQQIVKLKCLLIIGEIYGTPLIVLWKSSSFCLDFFHAFYLNRLIEFAAMVGLVVLWHRL